MNRTVAGLIQGSGSKFASLPALVRRLPDGSRETWTYARLLDDATALGTGLVDLGLEAREPVLLLADNRAEWILANWAVLLAGAFDVPRGSDVAPQEIAHILPHSGARLAIVEHPLLLARLADVPGALDAVRHVILMDGEAPGTLSLAGLLDRGRALRASGDRTLEERAAAIAPDDLAALIYTSGTTGVPKGVMLTHANLVSQVENIPFHLVPEDRILSILPVWHSYERIFEVICFALGCCTSYSSVATLADDLRVVRPTFMASAPRLWEVLHQRILRRVRAGSLGKRLLFRAALLVAKRVYLARASLAGRTLEPSTLPERLRAACTLLALALPWIAFDRTVCRALRGHLGGRLRGTISGGGALPREVDLFFNAVGIPLLEGYGLTETSPVVAFRTFSRNVIGTVGPLFAGTEVRFAGPAGEIEVRGPQLMKGYFRDEEATRAVLRDGWFRTGDLGAMTWNGCLRIVGRVKETIVLRSGENVQPAPIEARLCTSPLIEQVMLVGQDEKHLGALIVPALDRGRRCDDAAIARELERLLPSAEFRAWERVHVFRLLSGPFEEGTEVSATGKLRRHVIAENYREEIRALFPPAAQ